MKPRPFNEALALRWPWALAVVGMHGALWMTWPTQEVLAPPAQPEVEAPLILLNSLAVVPATPVDVWAPPAPPSQETWLPIPPVPAPPPAPDEPGPALAQPTVVAPASDSNAGAQLADRPALALTAPALDPLDHWPVTGAPIRLRLHIGADGGVRTVEVLACDERDRDFVQALSAILQATPHIPARKNGRDVASVKDIALSFGDPAGSGSDVPATAR